ncbi:hypothetical protein J3R30DRAFT_3295208 [Lentinula aciculospora]|uniref:Mid2 domain-containing protein n=1 Tax=Lentinula aciculospora TaxID=153920 RepID=A0A9W9A5H7_9AGAR|nr:hypothetical protein J3R30DRAFT_3295208 [Lentinula aciculospora]
MLTRWLHLYTISAWFSIYLSSIISCLAQQSGSLQNISISNTSPEIDYTPFLCNATGSESFSPSCLGGWQVLTVGGETVVSTEGAGPLGADVIPQMFLQFRASALFLSTSPSANATFEIAVSAGNTSISVSANSSIGVAAVLNLPANETTTLSLTFTPGQVPSRIDVGTITITVPDNSSISSVLPTQTLPPTISLPTFISSTSTGSSTSSPSNTSPSNSTHKQLVADAVGLTVGLGLGLTLITSLGYYTWKRRRRRQEDSEWRNTGDTQGQRTIALRRRTDNQDSTRWF